MAFFAEGPLANNVISIRQVVFAAFAADLDDVETGQGRSDVTSLLGDDEPNSIVGRRLDVSDTANPSLIALDAKAASRDEWLGRIGTLYLQGRDDAKQWWPHDYPSNDGTNTETDSDSGRLRARDVIQREIPFWWRAVATALALAATGRAWSAMTHAQVETAIAHVEDFRTGPHAAAGSLPFAVTGIQRWYQVGLTIAPSAGDNVSVPYLTRHLRPWAVASTYTTGYSDLLNVESGILVPRSPDYAWRLLTGYAAGYAALPTGWTPEMPT